MAVTIRTSGLSQTLAFFYAKAFAKSPSLPHELLLSQTAQFFVMNGFIADQQLALLLKNYDYQDSENRKKSILWYFLDAVIGTGFTAVQQRQATRETLKMLDWLRRFAAGKFGG
jgi:CRISPR type III-B/RAMP module-associated protein Cmr5